MGARLTVKAGAALGSVLRNAAGDVLLFALGGCLGAALLSLQPAPFELLPLVLI